MYFVIVIALTLVLPIGVSLAWSAFTTSGAPYIAVLGLCYVFFAVGVRLALAGLRQVFTPKFTLTEIFEIQSDEPKQIVQELGFANLSMSILGLLAPLNPAFSIGGAVAGGLYYGLAGLKHIATPGHNAKRMLAMITDLIVFAVCAAYVWWTLG